VRQEHIASLGSVPPEMTPADRLAFWMQVHPRLARLHNRLDEETFAKVVSELDAKVPMLMLDDPGLIGDRRAQRRGLDQSADRREGAA
jgi:hypothetical protein